MRGTINYVSPNGVPVPVGDTVGANAIAQWLGSDIQYSTSTIEEWRKTFTALSLGELNIGYQGTGNGYSVFTNSLIVLLESEYIENSTVCVSIVHILAALTEYQCFLESKRVEGRYATKPFEVEYLAEGKSAREYYLENDGSLHAS